MKFMIRLRAAVRGFCEAVVPSLLIVVPVAVLGLVTGGRSAELAVAGSAWLLGTLGVLGAACGLVQPEQVLDD